MNLGIDLSIKGQFKKLIDAVTYLLRDEFTTPDAEPITTTSVTFNGSTTMINCGSDASLDNLHDGALTFEAWIRPATWGEGGLGRIFATGTGWAFYCTTTYAVEANIACSPTGAKTNSSANSVVDGEWHHVAFTWDDASMDHPRVWVDGVEDVDGFTDRVGTINSDSSQDKIIGNNSGGSGTFDGDIAWVRISDNIRYTANFTPATKDVPPAVDGNTVEQWNLNDGSGSTATAEVSSPTNDGTITNGTWAEESRLAPITSPRTCEPGPGTLTVTDTNSAWGITGGKIVGNNSGAGTNDPILVTQSSYSRTAGFLYAHAITLTSSLNEDIYSGISSASAGTSNSEKFLFRGASEGLSVWPNAFVNISHPLSNDVQYQAIIVLRTTGAFYILDDTLLWVDNSRTTDDFYLAISNQASGADKYEHDYIRVAQLAAPWDTDNGIATDASLTSPSAGNTFTHEADFIGEFIAATIPSAGQIEVRFRAEDTSNYWQITIDSAGAVDLDEVVSGSPTQRGTDATGLTGGERILVIADGGLITVYADNTELFNYASAANFQPETSGEVETLGTGGAISNLITWPRRLS